MMKNSLIQRFCAWISHSCHKMTAPSGLQKGMRALALSALCAAAICPGAADASMSSLAMPVLAAQQEDWMQDGAWGFFQFYSSTQAANLCQGAQENPAASWSSLLKGLDLLEVCNEIRLAQGLEPLRVTDRLMALSMSTALASSSDHAIQIGEKDGLTCNKAWKMKNASETSAGLPYPYSSWYSDQKAILESQSDPLASSVYACQNLLDPQAKYTGLACLEEANGLMDVLGNPYAVDQVYVQLFSKALTPAELDYSVEEYRQRVEKYADYMRGARFERTYVMFRLFLPSTREHLYTADSQEASWLSEHGWSYEGIAWNSVDETASIPVYRLYNAGVKDHLYTTDANEKDYLSQHGWNDEGIGWYSPLDGDRQAIYRQFHPSLTSGSHNYTADKNEAKWLCTQGGWIDEGIAWYGRLIGQQK